MVVVVVVVVEFISVHRVEVTKVTNKQRVKKREKKVNNKGWKQKNITHIFRHHESGLPMVMAYLR